MATIVLSAAGMALGGSLGGSVLGLSSAVIGRAAGAMLGRAIDERLLGVVDSSHAEHGPEGLLPHDLHVVGAVCEDRGAEEVAVALLAACQEAGPRTEGGLDLGLDVGLLGRVDQGP